MRGRLGAVGLAATLVLAACGDAAEPTAVDVPALPGSPTPAAVTTPPPALDATRVASGAALYEEFCARCHGIDLAGAPDWQVPNDDGSYPPPPQDATGHTWHHPDDLLVDIVARGSDFPQSRMPAFGDELTDDQILAILDYFKASWGPEERAYQWEQTVRDRAES